MPAPARGGLASRADPVYSAENARLRTEVGQSQKERLRRGGSLRIWGKKQVMDSARGPNRHGRTTRLQSWEDEARGSKSYLADFFLCNTWTPNRICLIVMPGFHASSSFKMLRQYMNKSFGRLLTVRRDQRNHSNPIQNESKEGNALMLRIGQP